jgi:hypothetical protein
MQVDKKGDEDKQESGKAEKTAEVMDMVGVSRRGRSGIA